MIKIGLTGGIGTGKSTLASLFADLGVPIIDADVLAHELTVPGSTALQAIVDHFGAAILKSDGTLDRSQLARLVFNNQSERLWLEQLLHPRIQKEMLRQLMKLNTPYCIVVIPLLAETKNIHFLDRVLVIDAPESLQIERVQARNQLSTTQIKAILQSQCSREERAAIADDVIINEGSLDKLKQAVRLLHEKYVRLANQ
jgi:dephospho-CoA kinase